MKQLKYPYFYDTVDIAATPNPGLSGAFDCQGLVPVGIIIAGTITGASLSFQGSHDLTSYYDLWSGGSEVRVTGLGADRFYALNLDDFDAVRGLKIRSGISGTPIYEPQAKTITVVLRSP